jgi:cleavage and polyadenylation specificity factor subunit 1
MVNFYRRFLPGIAHVLAPLTSATKGKGRLTWTPEMTLSFQNAKSSLATAVPLKHPDPTAPLSLATDASNSHVGAVLQQKTNGSWQPLSFFSKKLSATETRYSTFDRELLAAFLSVKHFRFFLEGRPFTLFTDHKPLLAAISKQSTPFSSRQQRHLSFLSEFNASFQHLPGHKNVVADALSRPTISQISVASTATPSLLPLPLSYIDMATAQQTDPSILALQKSTSLNITSIPIAKSLSLLGDVSTNIFRPLVPSSFQKAIFEHMHSLGHPGIKATRRLISSRFVWSHMATDINQWTKECIPCQKAKIHHHVSPPPPFPSQSQKDVFPMSMSTLLAPFPPLRDVHTSSQ